MYQRAIEYGRMVLRDTDQNQADLRAHADNVASFPKAWQQAKTVVRRGLMPGAAGPERIQKQMDTGPLQNIAKPGALAAWLAGNQHFNPNTKQVFLALNYGRGPRLVHELRLRLLRRQKRTEAEMHLHCQRHVLQDAGR